MLIPLWDEVGSTQWKKGKRRKPMLSDFGPRYDFENFLLSEFNTMSGVPAPAHDRFEAGVRIVNALSDDLTLDMAEVDLDDLY